MSTHLFKRGTRYYFRRRVPQDLTQRLGKKEYTIALNTSDRSVAVTLCHGYDATYDIIFRDEREALRKGETKAGYWDTHVQARTGNRSSLVRPTLTTCAVTCWERISTTLRSPCGGS